MSFTVSNNGRLALLNVATQVSCPTNLSAIIGLSISKPHLYFFDVSIVEVYTCLKPFF